MPEKLPVRIRLIIEGLITLTIAITPLLFYSYKYLDPESPVIDFYLFEVHANNFPDARSNVWYILTKFIPLILCFIWFTTSKQWWYHVILIPISMFSFQLVQAFRDTEIVDENEIMYVIGVTMIIVPVVYFIRLKLVDKYVHGIDLKAMDTELQILKAKEELRKEREKLEKEKKALAKKM